MLLSPFALFLHFSLIHYFTEGCKLESNYINYGLISYIQSLKCHHHYVIHFFVKVFGFFKLKLKNSKIISSKIPEKTVSEPYLLVVWSSIFISHFFVGLQGVACRAVIVEKKRVTITVIQKLNR